MDKQASAPVSPSPPKPEDVAVRHTTPQSSSTAASQGPSSEEQAPSSQLQVQSSSPLELERHPKGKRKRTAAKDKSVLEAAYHANPKPDKAARLEIVNRVSLNEKEVQIWFQNRRQNDRRKSRPLSPQEIAALRYGGMQILSSDPAAPYNNTSPNSSSADRSPDQGHSYTEHRPSSAACSDPGVFNLEIDGKDGQKHDRAGADRPNRLSDVAATNSSQGADETNVSFQLSHSFPGAVGYLANRWNTASSLSSASTLGRRNGDESVTLESFSHSAGNSSSTAAASGLPCPNSQSSQFRLSLSLEGKAQVIESTTPPHLPPPRPSAEALASLPPVRRPSFHRSHSAQDSLTLPPISSLTASLPAAKSGALPPRLTRGRSRDVHAWQFACEVDKQEDPLIAQAKHESHGSALAAISLLRSTSSSSAGPSSASPLQPSSSAKRNAAMSKAPPRAGAVKKPKLARASTSLARLQTTHGGGQKKVSDSEKEVAETGDKAKFPAVVSPSGNDSDKENWSPDEEGNPHFRFNSPANSAPPVESPGKRRPLPSSSSSLQKHGRHNARRILQEQQHRPSLLSSRANTAPAFNRHRVGGKAPRAARLEILEDGSSPRSPGKENRPLVMVDDEVERFMRGEVSPSKKGDVDAVAGLLSLSQGNWR